MNPARHAISRAALAIAWRPLHMMLDATRRCSCRRC